MAINSPNNPLAAARSLLNPAPSVATVVSHVMPPTQSLAGLSAHRANPAQWMYERIAKQIEAFEEDLGDDEEVGMSLVAGGPDAIRIVDVGYAGPDMIMLYGANSLGRPVEVLQHYTQLNVVLTALPKVSEPAKRIGFELVKKVEDDAGQAADV